MAISESANADILHVQTELKNKNIKRFLIFIFNKLLISETR